MPVSEQDLRKLAARIERLERHTHKLPSRFVPPSGGGGGSGVWVRDNKTDLDALITDGKATEGHLGYTKDTNRLYVQGGSSWVAIPLIVGGVLEWYEGRFDVTGTSPVKLVVELGSSGSGYLDVTHLS